MDHKRLNFRNSSAERTTSDRSKADSLSNHVVMADDLTSPRNWAWTHRSDSYDWMDWHSPFPATSPSE